MTLSRGHYKITSKATKGLVGRAIAEDRSLLPKRILAGGPIPINDSPWVIAPVEGTRGYTLQALGASTVQFREKVYADLLGDIEDKVWVVKPQPQHGENVYTITTPGDEFIGWVVPNTEEDVQVRVGILPATKSLPPFFAESALFEIVPFGDDE